MDSSAVENGLSYHIHISISVPFRACFVLPSPNSDAPAVPLPVVMQSTCSQRCSQKCRWGAVEVRNRLPSQSHTLVISNVFLVQLGMALNFSSTDPFSSSALIYLHLPSLFPARSRMLCPSLSHSVADLGCTQFLGAFHRPFLTLHSSSILCPVPVSCTALLIVP